MELFVLILLAVAGVWWFFSINKNGNDNNVKESIKNVTKIKEVSSNLEETQSKQFKESVNDIIKNYESSISNTDETQDLIDTLNELTELHKGFSKTKPVMDAEQARMISHILLEKKTTAHSTKKEQLVIMIRNKAILTAFAWRTAGGIIVPDLKMFELIKDDMSVQEQKEYLALKEGDRKQVEKALNLCIMAELQTK